VCTLNSACVRVLVYMHSHIYVHTHTRTHTHSLTHRHALTHTTHTHTRTHTLSCTCADKRVMSAKECHPHIEQFYRLTALAPSPNASSPHPPDVHLTGVCLCLYACVCAYVCVRVCECVCLCVCTCFCVLTPSLFSAYINSHYGLNI